MESHYFLYQPQRHNVRGICPRLALIPGLRLRRESMSTRAHTNTHVGVYVCREKVLALRNPIYILSGPTRELKDFGYVLCAPVKRFSRSTTSI